MQEGKKDDVIFSFVFQLDKIKKKEWRGRRVDDPPTFNIDLMRLSTWEVLYTLRLCVPQWNVATYDTAIKWFFFLFKGAAAATKNSSWRLNSTFLPDSPEAKKKIQRNFPLFTKAINSFHDDEDESCIAVPERRCQRSKEGQRTRWYSVFMWKRKIKKRNDDATKLERTYLRPYRWIKITLKA